MRGHFAPSPKLSHRHERATQGYKHLRFIIKPCEPQNATPKSPQESSQNSLAKPTSFVARNVRLSGLVEPRPYAKKKWRPTLNSSCPAQTPETSLGALGFGVEVSGEETEDQLDGSVASWPGTSCPKGNQRTEPSEKKSFSTWPDLASSLEKASLWAAQNMKKNQGCRGQTVLSSLALTCPQTQKQRD